MEEHETQKSPKMVLPHRLPAIGQPPVRHPTNLSDAQPAPPPRILGAIRPSHSITEALSITMIPTLAKDADVSGERPSI